MDVELNSHSLEGPGGGGDRAGGAGTLTTAWRSHGLKRQDGDYRTVTRSQKLGQGLLAAGQMAFFLMQKLKLQYFGHLMQLTGKVPDAGKDWGQKEKSVSEAEMAGWHHQCKEHELGQTLGDGEGQGGLVCCSPWSRKKLDMTGRLNNNNKWLLPQQLPGRHHNSKWGSNSVSPRKR